MPILEFLHVYSRAFFASGVGLLVLSAIFYLTEGMAYGHKMNSWIITAAYGNAKGPPPEADYHTAIILELLGVICVLIAVFA